MDACSIASSRVCRTQRTHCRAVHPPFLSPKIESRRFTHWLPFVSNLFISSCGTYPFLTLIGALKVPSGLLDPGIQSYFGSSADILAASAHAFASSLDISPFFLQRQLYIVTLGS